MINLDRLKGSGLLVDGFDEFLGLWFENEKPDESPLVFEEAEANEIFEKLPYEVQRFYEVVHRWPQSQIVCENNQDHFIEKPAYQRTWEYPDWKEDRSFAILAGENQSNWQVVIGLDGDQSGSLFTDCDSEMNYPDDWIPMIAPPEEFLVTLAFHEMIICGNQGQYQDGTSEQARDFSPLFTGSYQGDYPIEVGYHSDGELGLLFDGRLGWTCKKFS